MKSASLVLALCVASSAAVAAEPAGSPGAPATPPATNMNAEAARGAKAPKAAVSPRDVTLQGDLTCAKCGLHEASSCESVLVVKEGGKDIKYYLANNAVAAAEHEKACGRSVPATVTGAVSEADGRKMLTATTVSTTGTAKAGTPQNGTTKGGTTKGGTTKGGTTKSGTTTDTAPRPRHGHE